MSNISFGSFMLAGVKPCGLQEIKEYAKKTAKGLPFGADVTVMKAADLEEMGIDLSHLYPTEDVVVITSNNPDPDERVKEEYAFHRAVAKHGQDMLDNGINLPYKENAYGKFAAS